MLKAAFTLLTALATALEMRFAFTYVIRLTCRSIRPATLGC